MIKREELTNPDSCMSRAQDNEMTFVLLARDAAAGHAIRAWASERVRIGKNSWHDAQIVQALNCALVMDEGRPEAQPAADALREQERKMENGVAKFHQELQADIARREHIARVEGRLAEIRLDPPGPKCACDLEVNYVCMWHGRERELERELAAARGPKA